MRYLIFISFYLIPHVIFYTNALAQDSEYLQKQYDIKIKDRKYQSALDISFKILDAFQKNDDDTSNDIVNSYKRIGNSYSLINKKDSAIYYYQKGLDMFKIYKNLNRLDQAKLIYNIGKINEDFEKYEQAIYLFNQSAEIIRQLNYPEFPFSDWPLNKIYQYTLSKKFNSNKIQILEERLNIFKKYHKENSKDFASLCQSLGTNYLLEENYQEALSFYEKSSEIYHSISPNNFDQAYNKVYIGGIYSHFSDYIKSERKYKEAIGILDNLALNDSTLFENQLFQNIYLATLDGLANSLYFLHNYEEALVLYEKRKNWYISINDIVGLNDVILSISSVYVVTNEKKKALDILIKQRNNNSTIDKTNIATYLKIQNAIFPLAQELKNSELEIEIITNNKLLSKKFYGVESAEYLKAIENECDFISKTFDTSKNNNRLKVDNRNMLIDNLNLYEKVALRTYKHFSDDYAYSINNLANHYEKIGMLDKAYKYYQIFDSISKSNKLPKNIVYFFQRRMYVNFLFKFKNYSLAYNILFDAINDKIKDIKLNMFNLSSTELKSFWSEERDFFRWALNLSTTMNDHIPQSSELSYNILLYSKSFLSNSERDYRLHINNTKDSNLSIAYNNLKFIKDKIFKYVSLNKDFISPNDSILINDLYFKSDSISKYLSRNIFGFSKDQTDITWMDIKRNLYSEEASIEFSDYYDLNDSNRYLIAIVLNRNFTRPLIVKLCKYDDFKIVDFQYSQQEQYSKIWEPLNSTLTGIKKIYYSPGSILNKVAFNGLFDGTNGGQTEYLIDKYELVQVGSTKILKDRDSLIKLKSINSIALFGGIDYNTIPDFYKTSLQNDYLNDQNNQFSNYIRDVKGTIPYLPGSKSEVDSISDLFKKNNWSVSLHTGKYATENTIKSLSTSNYKIIHIATHAFAFHSQEEFSLNSDYSKKNNFIVSESPLIRSGLLFSGANNTWRGYSKEIVKSTGEDGVLTALELSNLNFANTELIVLSACETAQGDIDDFEGVYGLKRGACLSGVRNMIISLWPVEDKCTVELMNIFYSEVFKKEDFLTAFMIAQKFMRNKYPDNPNKWAGFVFEKN
jgi:CHAT domain-containing protein/prefoldin subunit 5